MPSIFIIFCLGVKMNKHDDPAIPDINMVVSHAMRILA